MATRSRTFLVMLAIASLASLSGPASAIPQEPSLTVLGGSDALKVTGSSGEDTATGYISLLNPGKTPLQVKATFQAGSSDRVIVETVNPAQIDAEKAQRVSVTFGGLESLSETASGQLIVSGGAVPVAKAVEITPPQPSNSWPIGLIFGSLAVALLIALMVIGAMWNDDRKPLRYAAPGAKWSFSSWATTFTGVGGIFATVLAAATFPDFPDQISKTTLTNLSLFFAILVVLGPFLFQVLRKTKPDPVDAKGGRFGTNLTLLISCTVTLWAALGQLAAFGLLSRELLDDGGVEIAAIACIVLIGLLAARYFYYSMSEMVTKDWAAAEAEVEDQAEPRTMGLYRAVQAAKAAPERGSWPLL